MLRKTLYRCPFVVAAILAIAVPAVAHQAPPAEEAPAAAAAASGFQNDVAADLERTGEKLIALAEAIPAEHYGWRPAEGVRSVSEVLVHVTTANELIPAGLGATPPTHVELPQDMPGAMAWMLEREATTTAKADVIRDLRQSIAYAAGAVREMGAPALEESVDLFGFPASRRAYVLILLTHNHEHLGQAIAYARSLGVTPPWSEAPPAADGETEETEASTD